jgi:ferredoxin
MIRTRLSNELIMAGVLLVLLLYHLPRWYEDPAGILRFILLLGFGLFIDAVASYLRYKRLWCCVSGAVTAAMISLLTPGIPLWAQLLAVAFGLVAGKQIQGGTGKNISNPAMVGMIVILLFFDLPNQLFSASLLVLPAVLLGLVFLYFRPFAGIAFMLGMAAAMLLNHELNLTNVLSYGVFFWGCLVMTDPVTVTPNPVIGAVQGFLGSFLPIYFFRSPSLIIAAILLINILSDEMMEIPDKKSKGLRPRFRMPKLYQTDAAGAELLNLTGRDETEGIAQPKEQLSAGEILERIRNNEVFGMGGAAFSTYRKLKTVIESDRKEKYLIINAVECDPGLVHDKWLLMNRFTDIQKGAELLGECVGLKEIHLAVKESGNLMESLQLKIDQVAELYPVGAEKILIKEVLGQELKTNELPAASGILVLNVQTVYAVCQAVQLNQPADTRFLTVADLNKKEAKVVRVKLGMKLQEVMDAVYPGTVNIYAGGGCMQVSLAEEDALVDRSVNFIATGRMPKYKESPQCSKCGLCIKNCPCGLKVRKIADLVDKGKVPEAVKYKAEECISCGSCSYSCPAGHNLASRVKKAKEAEKVNKKAS